MRFDVRALRPDHLIAHITVEAVDEADARRQIEARGMLAASVSPARRPFVRFSRPSRNTRFSLVLFSQELLALLNAGLTIVEGLEALLEKEVGESARNVLGRLLSALRDGKRFSSALAEQPDLFPPLYVGIVRAAEGASDLPRSLQRFIDYQEGIDKVRSKIVSAAIYPTILMLVGSGVTFFLIGYVVPRFAEVYHGAGRELPWMSQLLLEWGKFAAAHGGLVSLFVASVAIALFLSVRGLAGSGGKVRLLSSIPGIGERAKIYELTRLYLTLGMLLEGGIPIVPAMQTVAGLVSYDMRVNLNAAQNSIEAGMTFSDAFEANTLTTPISVRMLRVGERSGELGRMLTQSAAFYDAEISRWIDRFTRAFEPLLMAAIGLVVGIIVVLLYMPIFDLAGSLS